MHEIFLQALKHCKRLSTLNSSMLENYKFVKFSFRQNFLSYGKSNYVSDKCYGGFVTTFANIRAAMHVNNLSHMFKDTYACCLSLASRLTTMSIDSVTFVFCY